MSDVLAWLSPATTAFLGALRENNDRAWFTAHKGDYVAHLKCPAEQFASALAGELAEQSGTPHEYRIFRIHRDVRFAKDKTPYNAHLHISLSPDGGCREGGPAWMFGLDPDGLTLGAGIFVSIEQDEARELSENVEEHRKVARIYFEREEHVEKEVFREE